jgi:hypothetical protein
VLFYEKFRLGACPRNAKIGILGAVSDCVEMYQNGQDENGAFFWHQIC